MTVAATKTKAEQALTQSFEAVASRLPGGKSLNANTLPIPMGSW